MTKIGYARVSTTDQDTSLQVEALTKAGCTIIRQEKASGTSTSGRPELATVLDFLRTGDQLVVTKVDRLARSLKDLQTITEAIRDKGASLVCVDQPVDTGSAMGKMFFDILGVFAEFETNLRKERQLDGIARAKEEDKDLPLNKRTYKGRKPAIKPEQIKQLKAEGLGATEIAKRLGIGRASVYRVG